MARTQQIYKIDIGEIARDLALAKVTGNQVTFDTIVSFCKMYSIPVDAEKVEELTLQYNAIKEALAKKTK